MLVSIVADAACPRQSPCGLWYWPLPLRAPASWMEILCNVNKELDKPMAPSSAFHVETLEAYLWWKAGGLQPFDLPLPVNSATAAPCGPTPGTQGNGAYNLSRPMAGGQHSNRDVVRKPRREKTSCAMPATRRAASTPAKASPSSGSEWEVFGGKKAAPVSSKVEAGELGR